MKWRNEFLPNGKDKLFQFAWVAESPINEQGERNLHIHLLMSWSVKLDQFHAWAKWIEGVWGKWYVKLERIRKPSAAANYMTKAARYICKGAQEDQ